MDLRVSEKGNAFVLILLGVVLFGALIMTLTRSGQQSISPMTKQQAKIAAQDILSYAQLVEQTVNKLRRKGCSESQLSFQYDADGDGDYNDSDEIYYNANAPTDHSCHVFHTNGGGASYRVPDDQWLDGQGAANFYQEWAFALSCAPDVGTHPTSGSCNTSSNTLAHGDLVLFLPWINESLCRQINNNLHNDSSIPVDVSNLFRSNAVFTGDYNVTTAHINPPSVFNPPSGCVTGNNNASSFIVVAGRYAFYHVLLAR